MKNKVLNKYVLFLVLSFQNLIYFFITFLNFNSLRGTDFNKYGRYFDYFYDAEKNQVGLESGISYYWFVTRFFNLLKTPLLYSENNIEATKTASIQLANFTLFIIGLVGIHYLLKASLNFKIENTLPLLILLSVFPPLIGARMILKPEILVFCLLPWLLLFYFEYFKSNLITYLILSSPILAVLLSLKASISFMLTFLLVVIFNKKILEKKFIAFNLISFGIFSLLIYENYLINGNYLWEHVAPDNYNSEATFDYLYNFNLADLWTNPYRDNFRNSMISILLIDTFGDYWQRYWFHFDGWGLKIDGNTRSKNFPGDLNVIRFSIFISLSFYFSSIYFLFTEKNRELRSLGLCGFIGIISLIINAINLFPFFSKNFDVDKGDPMKTHLFSFLLAFTFLYLLIKLNIHKNKYMFLFTFFCLNIFFISMTNPFDIFLVSGSEIYINRIETLFPCMFNTYCDSIQTIESTSKYFLTNKNGLLINKASLLLSFFVLLFYIFWNNSSKIFKN
jgi:hypothetical protein